jgi:hypothetical protein
LHVPKGTLDDPAGIDRYHDKAIFVDTSGKGCVEITEDMATMIAHHLPPRACIRKDSRNGSILTVKVESPEPSPDDPGEAVETPEPTTWKSSKAEIVAELIRLGATSSPTATKPELWAALKVLRQVDEDAKTE